MPSPTYHIVPMTLDHYEGVMALWRAAEGVGLRQADERESIARYLARNPGLSFVALADDEVVGAVLCGHDGRRGYLHHLAVAQPHRGRGAGRALAARALAGLKAVGIVKCHLFVFQNNREAIAFWRRIGWFQREDLLIMSHLEGEPNA